MNKSLSHVPTTEETLREVAHLLDGLAGIDAETEIELERLRLETRALIHMCTVNLTVAAKLGLDLLAPQIEAIKFQVMVRDTLPPGTLKSAQ